jgi:hypothetical protein
MDEPFFGPACLLGNLLVECLLKAVVGAEGNGETRQCCSEGAGTSVNAVSVLLGCFAGVELVAIVAAEFPDAVVDGSQDIQPWLDQIASGATSLNRERGGMGSAKTLFHRHGSGARIYFCGPGRPPATQKASLFVTLTSAGRNCPLRQCSSACV